MKEIAVMREFFSYSSTWSHGEIHNRAWGVGWSQVCSLEKAMMKWILKSK